MFETLDYDTVVVLDSHWFTTVEFVVTAQDRRAGLFTAEELPRGMCRIPYDWRGDPELARAIAAERGRARHLDHRDRRPLPADLLRDDQPVEVPRARASTSVDLDLGLPDRRDRGLPARWAARSATRSREIDRKVIAASPPARCRTRSGSCGELRKHEASDPEHIFTPEASAADLERLDWFDDGDHARVLETMPEFLHGSGPRRCSRHYLMMIGALGEATAPPRRRSTATTRTRSAPARCTCGSTGPPAGSPSRATHLEPLTAEQPTCTRGPGRS